MEAPTTIAQQPRRFHDGGVWASGDQPEIPPNDLEEPRIVLERRLVEGVEMFGMQRRIGYIDRELGVILVPDGPDLTSDLTSVPALFTWLVPKTGAHLPAALVHDGLCSPADHPTFVSVEGREAEVTRVVADRVFRDAMADTGTPLVRRWLVWAAVATYTMVHGHGTRWTRAQHRRYRWAALGSLLVTAALGVVATLDLFDVVAWLPWMGDADWWAELLRGAAVAVVVPAALGLLWGQFRIAGWIVLVGLALLLHVTLALLALTQVYRISEWLAARLMRTRRA